MPAAKHRNHNSIFTVLKRAGNSIDANSGSELTVKDLAKECRCNVKFLNHAFSAVFGCNARAFMQRYRAARLRDAIRNNPGGRIDRLAATCGMRLTPTEKRIFASIYSVSVESYQEECLEEASGSAIDISSENRTIASNWIADAIKLRQVVSTSAAETKGGKPYSQYSTTKMVG